MIFSKCHNHSSCYVFRKDHAISLSSKLKFRQSMAFSKCHNHLTPRSSNRSSNFSHDTSSSKFIIQFIYPHDSSNIIVYRAHTAFYHSNFKKFCSKDKSYRSFRFFHKFMRKTCALIESFRFPKT